MTPPFDPPRPRPGGRHTRVRRVVVVLFVALASAGVAAYLLSDALQPPPPANPFAALCHIDLDIADPAIARIAAGWCPEYAAMTLEVAPNFTLHPGHRAKLYALLREKTGQTFDDAEYDDWYRWLWSQPAPDPKVLFRLRYEFYSYRAFPLGSLAGYFEGEPVATIRADEIRWGGVLRDGIRPVHQPVMVPAAAADYLADGDTVYGVRINGDARAYPRRILGHHELVTDTVGGEPIAGVYCTLCETMIAYHSRTADGVTHAFGTSGFLYRSNKLMYDKDTLSLWHTMTGKPVVGRLVPAGLRLAQSPVVTTTWAEWRRANPDTRVMSLDGLPEPNGDIWPDYREGEAYRDYNATDELMFAVPVLDRRLRNKDEVFVPRLPGEHPPVAVAARYLAEHPVLLLDVGPTRVLVVTTPGGANRAFAVGDRVFSRAPDISTVTAADGTVWTVAEDGLRSPAGETLPRVPGHRAFWFGWYSAHPDTILVK